MTIYIIATASYTEDGDLDSSARVHLTLEEAKKDIREAYEDQRDGTSWNTPEEIAEMDEDEREGIKDEDAYFDEKNGMYWGTSGPNQEFEEIEVKELAIYL